jgi:peptidyl-prolyl cis-trans isomerase D
VTCFEDQQTAMAARPKNLIVKITTFVLFGLLIASFAVWGIGDIFRGSSQVSSIAEVGGEPIPTRDYTQALSREVNRLSARFGGQLDMDQARAFGIPEQVLNGMIGRALFDRKAADLGMLVTDDQIRRLIAQQDAFKNDRGGFDRARFEQQLRILGMGEGEYVETLRRDLIRQQLAGAVSAAVVVPRQLVEALYGYRNERRVAQYVMVRNDSITDMAAPNEPALEAFHKEFSERFMAPERRTVTLVELQAADLATESAVSEAQLREEFEARFEDFVTPETRGLEQIVFENGDQARDARTRLDGGADFATVAEEMTGDKPVDLGIMERDALPEELAEAAFALSDGTVSEPVESVLGWHILRVVKIEPRQEPTFAEVREELAEEVALRIAIDSMVAIANQLDDELGAGASLDEAARALGLTARRIEAIDRQGRDSAGEPVAELPAGAFLELAFETETGRKSLLTETADGDYFILRVDSVTPAQIRPLGEVRAEVTELWRGSQRAKLAREKAEALAARIGVGNEFEIIATEAGLTVSQTQPITRFETAVENTPSPALAAKLFQIGIGEVTTAAAAQGHLVAKLTEVVAADPDSDPDAVAAVRESLVGTLQSDLLEQFLATMRGEYGVQIKDQALAELLASF